MNPEDYTYLRIVLGLILCITFYLIGVHQGKAYARRLVVLEFNLIIRRLLAFAAKKDYINIHLLLNDLVDDEDPSEANNDFQETATQESTDKPS